MSQSHPPSEELFAYRDGELDPERRGLIEAHVLSCTACQARIDALSDAEGVLREQSGDPEAAYLDRLTDAVMARVAKEPAPRGAARPAAAAPALEPVRERPARRRNFEDEPGGRAPGLPWPAILSTASAAAAVVVVVVLLIQRPDAWRTAPRVARTPLPAESDGARGDAATDAKKETGSSADRGNGAADEVASSPGPDADALEGAAPTVGNETLAKSRAPEAAAQAPAEGGQVGFKGTVGVDERAEPARDLAASGRARTDEVRTQSAAEALPDDERRLAAEKKAADAPAKITGGVALRQEPSREAAPSSEPEAGPTYAEVVARHGLPPLYDPLRVRPEALLRAEPDLRALYQTGGAGADSARARIYLAEAARARAGENLDAETFDTIVHHYRRALQLAQDPATARVARQRLEDFVARSAPNR